MKNAMQHDEPLRRAVAELYRVFERHPAPTKLNSSPARDGPAILRALQSAPLRELTAEAVLPYAFWAETTVRSPGAYRHHLPRIFELAIDESVHLGTEPAIMVSRLKMAGWQNWPTNKRLAVRRAFVAAWTWALKYDPAECDALRWLAGLATLGDIADVLEAWRASTSPHAAEHFACLVRDQGHRLWSSKMIVGPTFWDYAEPKVREDIMTWLNNPKMRRWLDDAAANADPYTLWTVEVARMLLDQSTPTS